MIRSLVVPLVGIVVFASSLSAANPVVKERRDLDAGAAWAATMAPGLRLEVRGVTGTMQVTPADGDEASVSVAGDAGVELPRIELIEHDQGFSICTLYAAPGARRQNECVPGKDGRLLEGMKKGAPPPPLRFNVKVPPGVHFVGRIYEGNLSLQTAPVENDFNIHVLKGNVSIRDSGSRHISVDLGDGDIDAVLAPSQYERTVSLNALGNGVIRVSVPNVPIRYRLSPAKRVRSDLELAKAEIGDLSSGLIAGSGGALLRLNVDAGVLLGRIEVRRHAGR